jgi:two-component system phosphate regulon sensor histidine kinase PhoR
MNKRTTRTIVILSLSIVLPLIGYMIYQLSTIRQNEEIISTVYEEQLKSVLFSVNQYSNDFMSALMDKVQKIDPGSPALDSMIASELAAKGFGSYAIQSLDPETDFTTLFLAPLPDMDQKQTLSILSEFQNENEKTIKRLLDYADQGYRKIEPAGRVTVGQVQFQVIIVIIYIDGTAHMFSGFIEPLAFIQEVLSPKMQQIADKQLVLTLQEKGKPEILYQTDDLINDLLVTSKLWLFPEYEFGVSPKQDTIKVLIDNQRNTHIILIVLLAIFLTIGIAMLIRNIQKEARLNQAKSDFVSNVSHELRTPLALISMFAETILMGRHKDEKKQKEYIEIILKETHRLTNIVNRILNFSRIEANRRVYHLVPMDPAQLIQEIVRDYSYHLEQNGFELETALPDTSVSIQGDREAIYEAVIILIDNAMKYSEEIKHLHIRLNHADQQVHLTVSDHGMGIAKSKLDQIFDKFFRVSDNDKYVAQGAGLGLSILKHIMDAHDGDIKVESELGKGSHFTLTFKKYGQTISSR